MKNLIITALLLLPLSLSAGCATKTGSAAGGGVVGAAAGGGAYEYRLHQELQRIENDYAAGKMDQKEYQARKDEIQRMQLLK